MLELITEEFPLVRPLFAAPHAELVADGVISGSARGRIWVGRASSPEMALIWDMGHICYLAGLACDDESLARLGATVSRETKQYSQLVIHSLHDSWTGKLAKLLPTRVLKERRRSFYRLRPSDRRNSHAVTKPGFRIAAIDAALLSNTSLGNLARVLAEIDWMWPSREDFLSRGFGFCALDGVQIVSWCTAEYVSLGKCGVGIETVEQYQGRGLASLVSSAFAEHCCSRSLIAHRDCWSDNLPSVRVAEKVGYSKVEEYSVHIAGKAERGLPGE